MFLRMFFSLFLLDGWGADGFFYWVLFFFFGTGHNAYKLAARQAAINIKSDHLV